MATYISPEMSNVPSWCTQYGWGSNNKFTFSPKHIDNISVSTLYALNIQYLTHTNTKRHYKLLANVS